MRRWRWRCGWRKSCACLRKPVRLPFLFLIKSAILFSNVGVCGLDVSFSSIDLATEKLGLNFESGLVWFCFDVLVLFFFLGGGWGGFLLVPKA